MEGRVDAGIKNHLSKRFDLDARIEAGEVVKDLLEHPGWHFIDQIVDEFEGRGEIALETLRHEAAWAATIEKSVKYAQARGAQSGLVFHRDVVASVLASAERAQAELTKAQREADAEGGGS